MSRRAWYIAIAGTLLAVVGLAIAANSRVGTRIRRSVTLVVDEVADRRVFGECKVVVQHGSDDPHISDYDGNTIVPFPVHPPPAHVSGKFFRGKLRGVWAGKSVLIAKGDNVDDVPGYWLVTCDGQKARWFVEIDALLIAAEKYGVTAVPTFQDPTSFVIDR